MDKQTTQEYLKEARNLLERFSRINQRDGNVQSFYANLDNLQTDADNFLQDLKDETFKDIMNGAIE